MTSADPSLKVHDLSRRFGRIWAVRQVSGNFYPGTVTMVVGHNGSGKSTLMQLLAGVLQPTEGSITVHGHTLDGTATSRRQVAYLGHQPGIYGELNALENLDFFASLYGQELRTEHSEKILDRFALGRARKRPASTYSRGMLQRLALARIAVQGSNIWLLDEPMTGLDSAGREIFLSWLQEAKGAGKTVVTITHASAVVEPVVDQVLALESGRLKGGSV
jgi:heme ABC exporter ATP-binding subunit CcmA